MTRRPLEERRRSRAVLILVRHRIAERFSRRFDRFLRRTVMHDALSERDRAGRLPDHLADDRNDRRLDAVHAALESQHSGHIKNGRLL